MSGKTWLLTKIGAKLLFDLIISSMFSSDIPLGFQESIQVVPLISLMYFYLVKILINFETFLNFCFIFAPLRILNLFIKSFVNSFVNIALTFFHRSFNSFLFEVRSLLSKSVFLKRLGISLSLTKFACTNLAEKCCPDNLLNSWVVVYLSWSWSVVILFSISLIFVL